MKYQCPCGDIGSRLRWGCGHLSGWFADLCSIHGGCLKGLEVVRCACKVGQQADLSDYQCPQCHKLSLFYYRFNEFETGKICHSCQWDNRLIDEPSIVEVI